VTFAVSAGAGVELTRLGTVITTGSKRGLVLTSAGFEELGLSEIRARSPTNALKVVGVGPGEMTTFATDVSDGVTVTSGVAEGTGDGVASTFC